MPVPTIDEAEIYKSPYKLFDIRTFVRIDRPCFESPFIDHFTDSVINRDKWYTHKPSWCHVTLGGHTVRLGTDIPAISPSYLASVEGVAFPLKQTSDWVHEVRLRFPTLTGYGTFYRVTTLDDSEAIFSVKGHAVEGVTVEFRDGSPGTIRYNAGASTAWLRVKLEFIADGRVYRLTIDANDDGVFELGPWTVSAVDLLTDSIVIGNSVARQPMLGDFTEIEVDYVQTIGVSEPYEVPNWIGPEYMYSHLAYANQVWAELPAVLGGDITVHKRNITDALTLDLTNEAYVDEGPFPMSRLYTDVDFFNRQVYVQSRVSNGVLWTPWRTLYRGVCDEKQWEQRDNGQNVLSVAARDTVRRRLDNHHAIMAFCDWGEAVPGLIMNKTTQQIIEYLIQDTAGFPPTAVYVQETAHHKPRSFNVAGESLAQAITKLMEDVGFCWWVRLSDGQVQIRDWYWGTGTPQYYLNTGEEIKGLSWNSAITDVTGCVELTIENTDNQFSTNYPHAPYPFYGNTSYFTSITAQNAEDLYTAWGGRRLDYLRWQAENRGVGGINVRMNCQDWLEHDIEVAVRDDKYIGINPEKHGTFIIDGWTHRWQGTQSFTNEAMLVPRRPQDVIRRIRPGLIS